MRSILHERHRLPRAAWSVRLRAQLGRHADRARSNGMFFELRSGGCDEPAVPDELDVRLVHRDIHGREQADRGLPRRRHCRARCHVLVDRKMRCGLHVRDARHRDEVREDLQATSEYWLPRVHDVSRIHDGV